MLLDRESISGCLCFLSLRLVLSYQDVAYYLSYFSFLDLPPALSSFPLLLSISLHVYSHEVVLFTMEIVFYRLWPEKSPRPPPPLLVLYAAVLLMVFLMAADGRREPLALGLGVQRSFNKSQSVLCHYINIFGQLL